MINTKHLVKVASAWISIVYAICYVGVAIFPQSRVMYMRYALHANTSFQSDYFGVSYFIGGLILWNIVAIFLAWLFAALFNGIKK